jgi:hypothetical protein
MEGERRIHSIRRLFKTCHRRSKFLNSRWGFFFPYSYEIWTSFKNTILAVAVRQRASGIGQPQDIALADTPEFSQRFFAEVFNEFPALATSVVFLRLLGQTTSLLFPLSMIFS